VFEGQLLGVDYTSWIVGVLLLTGPPWWMKSSISKDEQSAGERTSISGSVSELMFRLPVSLLLLAAMTSVWGLIFAAGFALARLNEVGDEVRNYCAYFVASSAVWYSIAMAIRALSKPPREGLKYLRRCVFIVGGCGAKFVVVDVVLVLGGEAALEGDQKFLALVRGAAALIAGILARPRAHSLSN
jgi:hypothetical protein